MDTPSRNDSNSESTIIKQAGCFPGGVAGTSNWELEGFQNSGAGKYGSFSLQIMIVLHFNSLKWPDGFSLF